MEVPEAKKLLNLTREAARQIKPRCPHRGIVPPTRGGLLPYLLN